MEQYGIKTLHEHRASLEQKARFYYSLLLSLCHYYYYYYIIITIIIMAYCQVGDIFSVCRKIYRAEDGALLLYGEDVYCVSSLLRQ